MPDSSPLEEAFDMALDHREEATGVREKVTFRGEELDVLIYTQTEDIGPGAGGSSDSQPIRLSLRKSDVDLPIIALGDERVDEADAEEIVVRGKTLLVLTYDPLEARIDIIAGTGTDDLSES